MSSWKGEYATDVQNISSDKSAEITFCWALPHSGQECVRCGAVVERGALSNFRRDQLSNGA